MEDLLAWFNKMGVVVDGVQVKSGRAGRRIIATRPLEQGFVFFKVPGECTLSAKSCSTSKLGQLIKLQLKVGVPAEHEEVDSDEDRFTDRSMMYAFIMAADETAGTAEGFAAFLSLLRNGTARGPPAPGSLGATAFEWPRNAQELLPAAARDELRGLEGHILGQYRAAFPALSMAFPEAFPPEVCTEAAWLRAHGIYSSRAFDADPQRKLGAPGADGVLVPFLDCLNHDSEAANVEWLGPGLEEGCGARVTRPVLEGEELLYSYGCKGNTDLIRSYGFALWDNPHEAVEVGLELPVGAEACEAAAARLIEAGKLGGAEERGVGAVVFRLCLDDLDDGLPAGLLEAAAACVARDATYAGPSITRAQAQDQAGSENPNDAARALLRKVLLDIGKTLMWRPKSGLEGGAAVSGPAWERYAKGVRRRDGIRVGSHLCVSTPDGCAAALRSSQLQVLVAVLDLLEEGREEECKSELAWNVVHGSDGDGG
eukprot:TRINITY_DN57513_c0_g1_i1.p1 TRINITY_DN57513_c0_g1~~TRINITY_DN57513_c0_g1_i1.p1  ORF type:complete len:531 (+),score=88.40 TRINITY_DN57513_c0_g1_i1:144-1595(+)